MRTSIVSLGLASVAYSKLALTEQIHTLTAFKGEKEYFGEDSSLDWWEGSFKYDIKFDFGVRPTETGGMYATNGWDSFIPVGLWLDFNFWDYNTFFDFAMYNFYEKLELAKATVNLYFKGPSRPVIINQSTFDNPDDFTSNPTTQNPDTYCFNVGHSLRVANNKFRKNVNYKTCRQSWAKFIANDYEMDKKCGFDPMQEGETTESYLSHDLMHWLLVGAMDMSQADYEKLFPEKNWFLDDNHFCADFIDF